MKHEGMVHALEEIRRVLVPDGILIDLRPFADSWPIEVVSRRERRNVSHVTDLAPGLADDAAANAALEVAEQRGWYRREEGGSFALQYYWDSPNQMQEFIESDWSDFIEIADDAWKQIRSEWATADADARLTVRVKMLIARFRRLD
jgi:hypothetical protein